MSTKTPDSRLNHAEKALAILLRASAVLLLAALAPAVMPFSWMQEIHRHLGLGELPAGPIMGYLTRSLCLLYAIHGALVGFLSLDVRRYRPIVKCIAVLNMAFGIGMTVLDVMVGMPWPWTICEGPLILALGGVWLWLVGRVRPGHAEAVTVREG